MGNGNINGDGKWAFIRALLDRPSTWAVVILCAVLAHDYAANYRVISKLTELMEQTVEQVGERQKLEREFLSILKSLDDKLK